MKKIISLLLCGCIASATFATLSVSAADNIAGWAKETVQSAISDGIVPKSITSESDYTQNINRLQFSELIYNSFIKTGKVTEGKELKTPFTDVDNASITALYTDGVIAGKGDNKFAPDDNLTREEASTILGRAIKKYTNAMPLTSNSAKFLDDADIHNWAYNYVYLMKEAKILEGFDDGEFKPLNNMSKQEAIAVANRSRSAAKLTDVATPTTPPKATGSSSGGGNSRPSGSNNSTSGSNNSTSGNNSSTSGNSGTTSGTNSSTSGGTTVTPAPAATAAPNQNGGESDEQIEADGMVGDDVPDAPTEPDEPDEPFDEDDIYVDESIADGPSDSDYVDEEDYLPPTSEEFMEELDSLPTLEDLLKQDGLL